jgi:hypothetical protein
VGKNNQGREKIAISSDKQKTEEDGKRGVRKKKEGEEGERGR